MTFKYKNGALTCDEEIIGFTQDIKTWQTVGSFDYDSNYYGNRYFICESLSETQARNIASAIHVVMEIKPPINFIVE